MNRHSFYRCATLTPPVQIGNPLANAQSILKILEQLPEDTQLAIAPELCLSGYTCQDLFYEPLLLENCLTALELICKEMPTELALVVGLPLQIKNNLYNAAAFLFNGEVLGFYIKTYLPSYNEYYEPRWFSSAKELEENASIVFMNKKVPVSNRILFHDETVNATCGIEICEDLWVAIPISSTHALAGANILCNCSASNESIGKEAYRKELVQSQSAKLYAAYLYASAGPEESSSDLVFSGQNIIAENGKILKMTSLRNPKPFIVSDIDLSILQTDRIKHKSTFQEQVNGYQTISYQSRPATEIELLRTIDAYPFVPKEEAKRIERCQDILMIQARGLANRLQKIHCSNVVLGISGGLDSTLALLVCIRAFSLLGLDPKGIHGITMPGFGTTKRTKNNSTKLMELLGISTREISIVPAILQHFKDIDHDHTLHDITYENSQARERTQLLMDIANQVNGIVIGTGDLSELALGWCTYNGDHMSMYAVNTSVPKTLVRYIVESEALLAREEGKEDLSSVLLDICLTPVSPELLPPDPHGNIQQKTEESIGSYDLHDFFLYHLLRYHESPRKIFDLACLAFPNVSKKTILKTLKTFYSRFFTQQFKRNVMPDGIKVGSISFSPRGDWRMPSDASSTLWMNELDQITL